MNGPVDISGEIIFKTARSGGKGGQNVNKVESMVMGFFDIPHSSLLTAEQKTILLNKLKNRVNTEGVLLIKSQEHRSQLSNKEEVVRKMNELVRLSLKKVKKRLASQPSEASKQRRLESKKKQSEHKRNRQKLRNEY